MLNDYFEAMVAAVTSEGGEALKFMGDGLLAIFELKENEEPSQRCAAALKAARTASEKISLANLNRRAAGDPEIRFGLALHLGEVSYGNIGAPNRLDFTVIGPAVNHASRLEKIASELGRPVVTSASFAGRGAGAIRKPRQASLAGRRGTAGSILADNTVVILARMDMAAGWYAAPITFRRPICAWRRRTSTVRLLLPSQSGFEL